MASYVKTLKEANGDITYPQTLSSAVITTGGTDLETEMAKYVTATDIASTSALTPPVQTNMIADAAVTSAKLNWSSLPAPIVVSNSSNITKTTSVTWQTVDFYTEQKTFAAGKYFAISMIRLANTASGEKWISASVGNITSLCNQEFQSGTGAMQGVTGVSIVDIPSDGTYNVTMQAGSEGSGVSITIYRNSSIIFIRIG